MIGRQAEIEELMRMYESEESEFVAVYGRRRVGKTYLIRETFDGRFLFSHAGLANETAQKQRKSFFKSLQQSGSTARACPKDWLEAFRLLEELVARSSQARKVIFIDELPWMDTPRSGFLSALESFWNGFASARKDVLLIVCGSAASWMVKNLLRNRGGLHNRVTSRIRLMPFTLSECESLARERGLAVSRKDIAEYYMALGGIPYYWRYLDKRYSVAQNFDRLFFAEGAPLAEEFDELYASLFKDSALHKNIVEALATRKTGMTLGEVTEALGMSPTGKISEALETLEQSGFIRQYVAFGAKKKNAVYQLLDNLTLFHFRFLTGASRGDTTFWQTTVQSPAQRTWRGLSFELLCLQHTRELRVALGIAAVHVGLCAWRHRGNEVYPHGAQIDLLIDRSDAVINVCEMKYADVAYAITKDVMANLEMKREALRVVTKTRKAIHLTLVTTVGLERNMYSNGIQSVVTLDDLFGRGC